MGNNQSSPIRAQSPITQKKVSFGSVQVLNNEDSYRINMPNLQDIPSYVMLPKKNSVPFLNQIFDRMCVRDNCNIGEGFTITTPDSRSELVFFIEGNSSDYNVKIRNVIMTESFIASQVHSGSASFVTRNYRDRTTVVCMVEDTTTPIQLSFFLRDKVCPITVPTNKRDAINAFNTVASFGVVDLDYSFASYCTNQYNPSMSQQVVVILNNPIRICEDGSGYCNLKNRSLLKINLGNALYRASEGEKNKGDRTVRAAELFIKNFEEGGKQYRNEIISFFYSLISVLE